MEKVQKNTFFPRIFLPASAVPVQPDIKRTLSDMDTEDNPLVPGLAKHFLPPLDLLA